MGKGYKKPLSGRVKELKKKKKYAYIEYHACCAFANLAYYF